MKGFMKRLGIGLVSLFMLAYVGYQIFQVFYSNVTVETVVPYSVYETVETQAIAIRRELLVQAQVGDSHLYYTLQNGGRVAKGGTIAEIFPSAEAANVQERLKLLDEEIAQLQSVEALSENKYASMEAIDQQLAATAQQVGVHTHSASASSLRELHTQLLTLMNKRQIIVGSVKSFGDRLSAMKASRAQLAGKAAPYTGVVSAPVAGYFVDSVDGFETYFDGQEDLSTLSVEAVQKALTATPTPPKGCVGKVAEDFSWTLACVIDGEKAAKIEAGGALRIQLPFVTGDTIDTTVLAVNRDAAGKAAVILQCNLMSEQLAGLRIQTVQLLLTEHTGLMLPDKALQFDKENHAGAYVRVGTTISFRRVNVLYHNEKDGYSICEEVTDRAYVRAYDDIIVGGKDLYDGKVVQS